MELRAKAMTKEIATQIASWHYEPPYDFYNGDGTQELIEEMLDGAYKVVLDGENVIGFYCTGQSALVPFGHTVNAYRAPCIDLGLGMNPVFVGQGNGQLFCTFVIEQIEQENPQMPLRLTVATFNKRAIHLYEKLGFKEQLVFKTTTSQFMTMVKARINSELKVAIELRAQGKLEQSNKLLKELAASYPNDSFIQYQCAWSYDVLGLESQAVPHYVAAIQGNLAADDLQNAYLGLGSTYRALGEYEKSAQLLKEAINKFPGNEALKVFQALTLYNLNEHHEAMSQLLTILTRTTSDETILKCKRALDFYATRLDEVWN